MNTNQPHKAHPWHGINQGADFPEVVRAFIEIVPTDTVKYEVDKESGYLSLDRPQKFSNIVPSLYGFLPKSYCGPKMAELTNKALCRTDVEGDGDPLDICILTEKDVTHGDIIVNARPIGGLRLLDHNQADDKIIAVLKNDAVYGAMTDIEQVPPAIIRRLIHYFSTYKDIPGEIGSVGVSGMQSRVFDTFMQDLCDSTGANLNRCLENSFCLSADVSNAFDPNFPEVSDRRNNSRLNYGVAICKYTGSRGKGGASDASAEAMGHVRKTLDDAGVIWQIATLGKVDQGGGGTVAAYMANRNIVTVDAGVPVLSMHAPYELVSKLDCYHTMLACKAIYLA